MATLPLHIGCNLARTAIHRALTRLLERHQRDFIGPVRIEELAVQVDNCIVENKNNIFMAYLGSLVGRGIVGRLEVNFMIVGHTHVKIDQVFSRYVMIMRTLSCARA